MQVCHIITGVRRLLAITLVSWSALLSTVSNAAENSEWPTGPVKIVLNTKAGGSSDVFIRTLAKSLEPLIGQHVIVINAPGGGGASQLNKVRPATPDGQTLGINTVTHLTSMLTNLKGIFSPEDFSWIASTQEDAILLFVRADSDINNVDDLIAKARKGDGEVSVGGYGPVGSMQHIGMSMLEDAAGVKFNWIGFNSTPDIISTLLGGHIDVGVSNLGSTLSFIEARRLKGIGVLGAERLTGLPAVKTFGEQGYQVDTSWVQVRGVFGPAGIPKATQEKIAAAFHEAMRSEHYQQYARASGVVDSWKGPEAYTQFVENVSKVAKKQLKTAGVLR